MCIKHKKPDKRCSAKCEALKKYAEWDSEIKHLSQWCYTEPINHIRSIWEEFKTGVHYGDPTCYPWQNT